MALVTALLLLGLGLLALDGCTAPASRLQDRAAALGFHEAVVPGAGFEHVVYWRPGRSSSPALHVYLDGDGTPWRGRQPASDPTPRHPLALELMAIDPAPAAYLGRPCYHGRAAAPGCEPRLWTQARYSEAVVSSMEAATRRLLDGGGYRQVRWFGYSGGGTLAMLLAPRFAETAAVITVAANLDIDLWARGHRYAQLDGSLNPAAGPGLPAGIRQRHYAGERDEVVPARVVAAGPIPPGSLVVVPGYDHRCCWKALWPRILRDLAGARRGRAPLTTPSARRRSRRPRAPRT